MTNVKKFIELARRITYYEAAEGQSWYSEGEARSKCYAEAIELRDKLIQQGVDTDTLVRENSPLGHSLLVGGRY